MAKAQTTWTNGGGDALWATPANWDVSSPSSGVAVLFPSAIPPGGGVITLPNVAVAGSLSFSNSYTLTGGQLALDAAGGPISVASGFTATIGSTLNGTTGLTVSGGGTLVVAADANLSNLTVGSFIADTTASNLHFSANVTFSGTMLVQVNSATSNTITIDSGKKLQIGGSTVFLGDNSTANVNTRTVIDFAGGGDFVYDRASNGTFQVGGHQTSNTFGGNNVATVDMSGLATATVRVSATTGIVRIGDSQQNANGSQASAGSTWTLAPTTTITASRLSVGGESASLNSVHTLRLGAVKTEINAGTISMGAANFNAGTNRGSGVVEFAVSTGTLKIRAADGAGAAVLDMVNNNEATNSSMGATMNLNGHQSDVLLSTFTMASRRNSTSSSGAGNATATFNFDTGTLTVTTLNASRRVGTTTNPNTSGTMTSTINLGGGTVTIGTLDLASNTANTNAGGGVVASVNVSGGTVSVGSIVMATTSGASGNVATSSLTITGGGVTLGSDIVRTPGGVGVENTTLTLDGGTLDMAGFAIGTSDAAVGSGTGALNLRSGTLRNVAQINGGAAVSKTTSGTLVLAGTNTFTGDLNVAGGKWLVNGMHNGAGSYAIAGGATLGGSGTINLGAGKQIDVATIAIVSPGAGYSGTDPADAMNVGTLTVGGAGTLMTMAGTLQIDVVSPLSYDRLAVADTIDILKPAILEVNGEADFTRLNFSTLGFAAGDRVDLVTGASITGDFSNFVVNTSFTDAGGNKIFFGHDGTAVYFSMAAVPEPHSTVIIAALALLAGKRWRRRPASLPGQGHPSGDPDAGGSGAE